MSDAVPFLVLAVLYAVFVMAGIVDAVGGWQFWAPSYTTGVPILREDDLSLRPPVEAIGTVFETENGKFKLVAADRLLVRQRFRFGRSKGQLRGAITWIAGCARVEARMPWVYALSFGLMLAFIAVVFVQTGFQPELLIFVAFIPIVAWVNVAWDRKMMLRVLDEYKQAQQAVTPHA